MGCFTKWTSTIKHVNRVGAPSYTAAHRNSFFLAFESKDNSPPRLHTTATCEDPPQPAHRYTSTTTPHTPLNQAKPHHTQARLPHHLSAIDKTLTGFPGGTIWPFHIGSVRSILTPRAPWHEHDIHTDTQTHTYMQTHFSVPLM